MPYNNFLPTSKDELQKRGWNRLDIILITGDAYVDHPAFGIAVIGRVLENNGFRVGIISMPDWKDPSSIDALGRPGLFFGVAGGAVDSMISKYTAFKRKRSDDPYTPGKASYERPDRAIITYCNLIKNRYKDVPIVIGGIEASMRRIAHYDYWSNKVRRSIIEDSRADILVYGMGEGQIIEIARKYASGMKPENIPGTVILSKDVPEDSVMLPREEDVMNDKDSFSDLYSTFYRKQHRVLVQRTGKRYIIHNPPPVESKIKIDDIFDLPFSRLPYISYKESVPAFEMIKNSIISHRGCFSGCSFCSLSLHQGRKIISRSRGSIINEVKKIAKGPDFKGHITDIGGPSANMYQFNCSTNWKCSRDSCLYPGLCKNIKFNTAKWIDTLGKASSVPGVNRVTIGSGIRYDLFMSDPESKYSLKKIVKSHISGQLKIAPEHTSEKVLRAMRKTPLYDLGEFINKFRESTAGAGKKQYLVPYFMSCHPGCTYGDMTKARREMLGLFNFIPNQVQAFIPLPMTLSSVMYYTGRDPLTGEEFHVTRDMNRKRKQHNIFFN
ncbi:YgiQ family radical SAM protein [Thermodesulfobacteriota bacterium]